MLNTTWDSLAALDRPTWFRRAVLYVFVVSVVLIPINFNKLKFVILATFITMCADVTWRLIRRPRIPYSPVYLSIALFTLIYSAWLLLSLHYGNNLVHLLKDSAGFLVYFVFPVLYVFVVTNQLAAALGRAILVATALVVGINIISFIVFYVVFGTLNLPNLLALNAGLSSLGFTWELGASNGVLRANTKAGHYILMGIALLTYRFTQKKQTRYLLLIGAFFVGALLDGHKALLVAIAIFAVMVSPLLVLNLERRPLKLLTPVFLGVSFLLVTFTMFIDAAALIERFSDFGSGSFQTRKAQIGPLLDAIEDRPFIGSGFGASASLVRGDFRPFMYEVDFLAVGMKLGIIGSTAYFLVYMGTIAWPLLGRASTYHITIFSLGMAYLFYMGTNGGFAMSPISAFFHLLLFMCVSTKVLPEPNSNYLAPSVNAGYSS